MILNSKFKIQNSKLTSYAGLAIINSESGMALVVSLLLLLVATVVGLTALSTSTTNVMIAGNQRLMEINFSGADSGVSVTIPVIETTAYDRAISSTYTGLVTDTANFVNEITGALAMNNDTALAAPDLQFALGSGAAATTVSMDVDYLYSGYPEGSSIEFAAGYEGLGKGAAAGGMEVYYSIRSSSAGVVGSETDVCALYKYIAR